MVSAHHVKSMFADLKALLSPVALIAPSFILAPFRAWNEFWKVETQINTENPVISHDRIGFPQRLVWQAYYATLSILLQLESIYPSVTAGKRASEEEMYLYETKFFSKPKLQQGLELKSVEAIYEVFLLKELSFPKANEINPEVEYWTDEVMSNWKVMCGATWHQLDHPDGGKRVVGRRTLEVGY